MLIEYYGGKELTDSHLRLHALELLLIHDCEGLAAELFNLESARLKVRRQKNVN